MGTLLGARLCSANIVSVVEKGTRYENIRQQGFRLIQTDGTTLRRRPDKVSSDCAGMGPQDFVFLAVKAYDLIEATENIAILLDDNTAIVTIQNGIPWWYFQNHPGRLANTRLKSLDPEGLLADRIDPNRIIGCVAYPAAELLEDGSVQHVEGFRLPVGELDGQVRERTERLVELLEEAGFKSRALSDIRSEYWLKAWGALSINPVSALTGAKMDEICTYDPTRQLVATLMKEAEGVAKSLGISFRHSIEERIEGAKAVGPHRTSMLCDLEAGRRLETEALIGSIIELAQMCGQAVASIEAVHACLLLLAATRSSKPNERVARPGFGSRPIQ